MAIHGALGGDAVGGEIGCVFLAGVLLAAGKGLAARVLPAFAGVIPMKAKLREVGAEFLNRLLGEGNPNPLANYFGEFVRAGHPLAEGVEDFFNRELAVAVAFLEIHVGPYRFLRGGWGCCFCGAVAVWLLLFPLNCSDRLWSSDLFFFSVLFCLFVFMVFFFVLCCSASVSRSSPKKPAYQGGRWE